MFFGTEGRIAAEENALARTHHRRLVDDRAIPFVELDADVALDPRERIVLADRKDDVVALGIVTSPTTVPRSMRPFSSMLYSIMLELHADELAVLR